MAHKIQSRPDYGLRFHAEVVETLYVVPSSLGSDFAGGGGNRI